MTPSRRSFITGLAASIITAPAIVRAASLMPVKVMPSVLSLDPAMPEQMVALLHQRLNDAYCIMRDNLAHAFFETPGYPPANWRPTLLDDKYSFAEVGTIVSFGAPHDDL